MGSRLNGIVRCPKCGGEVDPEELQGGVWQYLCRDENCLGIVPARRDEDMIRIGRMIKAKQEALAEAEKERQDHELKEKAKDYC